MVKYKSIIIDDEEQAINALSLELKLHCPEVEIVDVATNVVDAVRVIQRESPDLVFLDIRLTDGTGFDVLDGLNDKRFKVIFTTAYTDFAIKAFKFNALDYLLKPINGEELKDSVRRIMHLENTELKSKINNLIANHSLKDQNKKIAVQTSDGIHLYAMNTIVRLQSERNYTRIFLTNGKSFLSAKTLKDFDELLAPFDFYRVHQSHLINAQQISRYHSKDGGYLTMDDGSDVPVSSRKKHSILELLRGI